MVTDAPETSFEARALRAFLVSALSALVFPANFTVILTGLAIETLAEKVMMVAGNETAALVAFAALVVMTMHVPALVADRRPPATTHPVAVPLDTLYVSAPPPSSPLAARGEWRTDLARDGGDRQRRLDARRGCTPAAWTRPPAG